jgi:inosose dehydratase
MKIANAPCSWGILEFGLDGKTADYETMLDEMGATGYEGTELGDWGFLPTNPDILKEQLNSRGLNLVGAFVPVNFINPDDHKKGLNLALKTAELLAQTDQVNARIILSDDNGKDPVRTKNAGRIKPQHGLNSTQWDIFTDGVEKIAEMVLEETGIKSVFHHHCAGYVETPAEIDEFLQITDPNLINLCFDTGHYAFGGGAPEIGLKKHAHRITHVHFKGWNPKIHQQSKDKQWDYFESVNNGIFCELGQGTIKFEAILNELNRQKYADWIVVEQDVLPGMGTPKASAKRNREFLRSIGV